MFFRRLRDATQLNKAVAARPHEVRYPIDFDRLVKGAVCVRNGERVRQFGVYMDGTIRLITSGDWVDRETYEALLAAGAVEGELPLGLQVSGGRSAALLAAEYSQE